MTPENAQKYAALMKEAYAKFEEADALLAADAAPAPGTGGSGPAPTPSTPAPTPPATHTPAAPKVVSVECVTPAPYAEAKAQAGVKVKHRITTEGMDEVKYAIVQDNASRSWRAQGIVKTSGVAEVELVFLATSGEGELLKALHTTDSAISKDGPRVPVKAFKA